MRYRIFSQSPPGELDLDAIEKAAKRHSSVEVAAAEDLDSTRIRVTGGSGAIEVTLRTRGATPEDRDAARRAERRSRAAGMADLAARCPSIWMLDAEAAAADDPLLLELCAVLASVALGPVLPPDEGTLFGVRGARERAARRRRP